MIYRRCIPLMVIGLISLLGQALAQDAELITPTDDQRAELAKIAEISNELGRTDAERLQLRLDLTNTALSFLRRRQAEAILNRAASDLAVASALAGKSAVGETARQMRQPIVIDPQPTPALTERRLASLMTDRSLGFDAEPNPARLLIGRFPRALERAVEEAEEPATPLIEDETWRQNMTALLDEEPEALDRRIFSLVGGSPTQDLPDCVALGEYKAGRFYTCCTGTLIAPRTVLTAAHCVNEPACPVTHVFVGTDANRARPEQVYTIIDEPIVREGYVSPRRGNDLALLRLDRVAEFDGRPVRPRGLARAADVDAARRLLAAGFGKTESDVVGVKFEAALAVASARCALNDRLRHGCNLDTEIVAGGAGFDTCQGDSGGPVYLKLPDDPRLVLAGVTCRGGRCGFGGLYTRVGLEDSHGQWILSHVPELREEVGALPENAARPAVASE